MSVSYFFDGGVSSGGTTATSVYRIDNDAELPTGQLTVPNGALTCKPSVSVDGRYVCLCYDSSPSILVLDTLDGSYTLNGGPTGGAATSVFTPDARLIVCGAASVFTLNNPYTTASEAELPVSATAALISPDGARVVLIKNGGVAQIFNLDTHVASSEFPLSDIINATYLQISPDGLRFMILGGFDGDLAYGVFNAVTGEFINSSNPATLATATFLSDSVRVAHRISDTGTLSIFNSDTSELSTVSLAALNNNPTGVMASDYRIAGITDDDHVLMEIFGYTRRVSLADGSVPSTPQANIAANGVIALQPIAGGGESISYFWQNLTNAYETPLISAG